MEKSLMLGKTDGRKKRVAEDEMVKQHHQLNGHEFWWIQELVMDGEEPGRLQSMGLQRVG